MAGGQLQRGQTGATHIGTQPMLLSLLNAANSMHGAITSIVFL